MEYNENFENHGIPLDVIWSDLPYTDNNEYFKFSRAKFPTNLLERMKLTIDMSRRKLVVITDPHISNSDTFSVHLSGNDVEEYEEENGIVYNIWVKRFDGDHFVGHCWSGSSKYVDYINEEARKWWGSLYDYSFF